MYQGNRPPQGRPPSRPYQGNRNPQRKRKPFKKLPPPGPTRAQVRNERNKRIEYHLINILRVAMKPEKFEELLNRAKRLADHEIAKLAAKNISSDPAASQTSNSRQG